MPLNVQPEEVLYKCLATLHYIFPLMQYICMHSEKRQQRQCGTIQLMCGFLGIFGYLNKPIFSTCISVQVFKWQEMQAL